MQQVGEVRKMCSLRCALAMLVGCSGGSAVNPSNVEVHPRPLIVSVDQPLGWLGFAPRSSSDEQATWWLPIDHHAVVIAGRAKGLSPGRTMRVVPARGNASQLVVAGAATIHYGCEANQLDIVALDGPAFAPQIVWITPPSAPAAWAPAGVELRGHLDPAHASWRTGRFVIDETRLDDTHATLAISAGPRTMLRSPEATYMMDGADLPSIDFTRDTPGIPKPVAAFSIAPEGPMLVVLASPGYEGTTLSTLLVDDEHAQAVESLEVNLYYCAF